MLLTTITWIIVANARQCRAFEERRRGGALKELEAWACEQSEQDRRHGHYQPAVGHRRFGFGWSVVNPRDFEAQAERRFLTRYAHRLRLASAKGRYTRLLIIASPRALGVLREELGRPLQRHVERTAVCDCLDEAAPALRERLRSLRVPY